MKHYDTAAEAHADGYNLGHRDGYRKGEMERVALATANSELRSELRELKGETE